MWKTIDKFFKQTTKSLFEQPQVWKLIQRDTWLTSLRKSTQAADVCKDGLTKYLEMKR